MNLANWITALRIILAPVCVGILFWDIPGRNLLATVIFIIAGLTDGLDGYVARSRKEITAFGKWFDPFADKVLIIFTLVVLAQLKQVPWFAVWIIIAREVLITVLRALAGRQGLSIGASIWGKAKTFFQTIAIALIMINQMVPVPFCLGFLWFAVGLTVWSGIDYLWLWRTAWLKPHSKKKAPEAENLKS